MVHGERLKLFTTSLYTRKFSVTHTPGRSYLLLLFLVYSRQMFASRARNESKNTRYIISEIKQAYYCVTGHFLLHFMPVPRISYRIYFVISNNAIVTRHCIKSARHIYSFKSCIIALNAHLCKAAMAEIESRSCPFAGQISPTIHPLTL